MKKKSLLTMVLAFTLTAVVAVGGTLAYLSATDSITNTFVVGTGYTDDDDNHHGIWLDELKIGEQEGGQRTDEDQTYSGLMPGRTVIKDPTAHIVAGSVASYVFIKLEGVDALEAVTVNGVKAFSVTGWDAAEWTPLGIAAGSRDGYYVYKEIVDVSGSAVSADTSAIFKEISMSGDLTGLPAGALPKIAAKAVAVQAADDMVAQAGKDENGNGIDDAIDVAFAAAKNAVGE